MNTHFPSGDSLVPYELELHYVRPLFDTQQHIGNSKDAVALLRSYTHPKRISLKEFFWVILLTQAHRVIGLSEVGSGNSQSVISSTKEILQLALLSNASAIILAHNHPSGNLKASQTDIAFTTKIRTLSKMMEVNVLDHVILTAESYTSLADTQQL